MRTGKLLRSKVLSAALGLCGCAAGAGAVIPGEALKEPYAAGFCASFRAGVGSFGAAITYAHLEESTDGSPSDLVMAAAYARLTARVAELYAGGGVGYEDPDVQTFPPSEGELTFLELGVAANAGSLGVRASYVFFPWSETVPDVAFVFVEYLF